MLSLKIRGIPNAPRLGLQISAIGTAVFLICAVLGVGLTVRFNNPIPAASGIAMVSISCSPFAWRSNGSGPRCCDWDVTSVCVAPGSS
jgi:hypothetical protein